MHECLSRGQPGVRPQFVERTLKGSGSRDIARRVPRVGPGTVILRLERGECLPHEVTLALHLSNAV